MDVDNERPTAEDDVMDYDESMEAEHEHGDDEMMEDEEYEEEGEETMEAEPVHALTVDDTAQPIEAEPIPTASEMGITPEAVEVTPVAPPPPFPQVEAALGSDVIDAASDSKPAAAGENIGDDSPLVTSESLLPALQEDFDAGSATTAPVTTPAAPTSQAEVGEKQEMDREPENGVTAPSPEQADYDGQQAHAESADPTTDDQDADEEDEADYGLDLHSMPSIIINLPKLGARCLFEPLPGDAGLKLPVWLLGKEEEFGEASLSDLLEALKQVLQKEDLVTPGQLVLTEKQMGLIMCEDDKNLQTITLLDLLQLHQDCELPVPVQLFVSFDNSRFIARFEAIMHELDVRAEKESSEQTETQENQDGTEDDAGAAEPEYEDHAGNATQDEEGEGGEEDEEAFEEDVDEAVVQEPTIERSRRAERPTREDVGARYGDSIGEGASRMRSLPTPDSAPRTPSTTMTEFLRRGPEPLSVPSVDDVSVSVPPPLRPGIIPSEDQIPAATGTPAPPSVIEEVDEDNLADEKLTKASSQPEKDTASTLLSTDFSTIDTVSVDVVAPSRSEAPHSGALPSPKPVEKADPVSANDHHRDNIETRADDEDDEHEREGDEFGIDSFVEQVGDGEEYDDDVAETLDSLPNNAHEAVQSASEVAARPVNDLPAAARSQLRKHEDDNSGDTEPVLVAKQPDDVPEGSESQEEEYYEEDDEEYKDEEVAVEEAASSGQNDSGDRSPTVGREEPSAPETASSVDNSLEFAQPETAQTVTGDLISSSVDPVSGLPSSISLSSDSILSPVKRSFPSDELDDNITLETKKAKTEVTNDTDATAKQV